MIRSPRCIRQEGTFGSNPILTLLCVALAIPLLAGCTDDDENETDRQSAAQFWSGPQRDYRVDVLPFLFRAPQPAILQAAIHPRDPVVYTYRHGAIEIADRGRVAPSAALPQRKGITKRLIGGRRAQVAQVPSPDPDLGGATRTVAVRIAGRTFTFACNGADDPAIARGCEAMVASVRVKRPGVRPRGELRFPAGSAQSTFLHPAAYEWVHRLDRLRPWSGGDYFPPLLEAVALDSRTFIALVDLADTGDLAPRDLANLVLGRAHADTVMLDERDGKLVAEDVAGVKVRVRWRWWFTDRELLWCQWSDARSAAASAACDRAAATLET